jgi:hypothetical protein
LNINQWGTIIFRAHIINKRRAILAYINLPKFEEMSPNIHKRARPILEKTGKLGEIFELLAIREDIYFATDGMVQEYLIKKNGIAIRYEGTNRVADLFRE